MTHILRKVLAFTAVSLAVVGLSACSGSASGASDSPVGSWGEVETRGETSLVFEDDGSYHGSDGCNNVMGSWEAAGDSISVAPMASTLMACEGVEVWLVDAETVNVEGDTLVVFDSNGKEIGSLARG